MSFCACVAVRTREAASGGAAAARRRARGGEKSEEILLSSAGARMSCPPQCAPSGPVERAFSGGARACARGAVTRGVLEYLGYMKAVRMEGMRYRGTRQLSLLRRLPRYATEPSGTPGTWKVPSAVKFRPERNKAKDEKDGFALRRGGGGRKKEEEE